MHPMVPNMHRPKNVVSCEMSTENRGVILGGGQRSSDTRQGRIGRSGRNAAQEPADIEFGPNGQTGVNDPMNCPDWDGDFDGSTYEGY
jgi:hypothetical protein